MSKQELTWEQVEEMFKFNEMLVKDLTATTCEKEADAVLQAHGCEATIGEILDAAPERLLSEEELTKVSGGGSFANNLHELLQYLGLKRK